MKINITFEQGTGFDPRIVRIITNATLAQVTTAGWLNPSVKEGIYILPSDKILIYYNVDATPGNAFFDVSIAAATGIITLSVAEVNVITPTILNHIAVFTNTSGTIGEDATTAINGGNIQAGLSGTAGYLASFPSALAKGSLRLTAVANTADTLVTISNALHGQASVYSIPDSGAATANFIISALSGVQHITSGSLQVDGGGLLAGLAAGGTAASLTLYPNTTANGFFKMLAVNAGAAFNTIISNSTMGQSSTISIPDPGAATANFLLSASGGVQHITAGSFQVDGGHILAGLAAGGTAGDVTLYPPTTANGSLIVKAVNAGGAFNTTVSNGTMGQSSVITIPDPGAATSKFVLQDGTNTSGTFTTLNAVNLKYGATPVAQVDPASCTIAAVAGAANVATVTIQLKDGSGTNMARIIPFMVYSSSAADGLTLQSAASTGYSVASGGLSLNNGEAITTQIRAISSATGGCVLSLTDTGKQTSYLVLVLANGTKISAQLSAGSYG